MENFEIFYGCKLATKLNELAIGCE